MSSSVILFGFGRRETFKVSPTTPLSQLRDEFCSRNGLDAALYGLKYLQRDVDTSLTFRMANLPAGAKVEVIRREASTVVGDVRVAVQTGDGERKTAVIATTSSLWDLLLALNVDIPADTEPTLVYMNRSYTGVPVLSSTSLAKIGAAAGSSVLLRLQFGALSAQSDVPSPAASASRTVINEAFLETAKPAMDLAPPVATSSSVSSSSSSASSSASSSSSAASSSGATSVSRKSHVPEDRNVQVFLPSSNAPRIDLPEEYYEVTADDIKTLLASQQQSAAETEYLKTQAMRDAEAAKKARIYSKSVLRVRFPDGLLLQATFSPWETIGAVTLFVKSQLQDRDATFDLFLSPPRRVFKVPTQTLMDAGLVPAAVINLSPLSGSCELNDAMKTKVRELHEAEPVDLLPDRIGDKTREELEREEAERKKKEAAASSASAAQEQREAKEKRLAAMLKLGGKKS